MSSDDDPIEGDGDDSYEVQPSNFAWLYVLHICEL
jgi:hypothetical protein